MNTEKQEDIISTNEKHSSIQFWDQMKTSNFHINRRDHFFLHYIHFLIIPELMSEYVDNAEIT